jgi:ABC-2 type transport system ATP-binding protein
MDTPEGLANQVKGAERVAMLVDGPVDAVCEKLSAVEGVLSVKADGGDDSLSRLTLECKLNTDLRRTLAAVVVNQGWGLLELRGVSVSLEDVFINLITNE